MRGGVAVSDVRRRPTRGRGGGRHSACELAAGREVRPGTGVHALTLYHRFHIDFDQ